MKKSGALLALGSALFAAHAVWRARGLRGTDQYWYVGDVKLRRATGKSITNHVVPRSTTPLGSSDPSSPPPWIHNVPVTHLVCRVDRFLDDPYRSWSLANTGLVMGAALTVHGILRRRITPAVAAVAAGSVLAFPLSTWFSVNALSEAALVALGAMFAGATDRMDTGGYASGILAASAVSGVMYLQRDNHAPQLGACFATAVWLRYRRLVPAVVPVAVGAMTLGAVAIRARLLPSMIGISAKEMLMATIGDNTVLYQALPWSGRRFAAKVPSGLVQAVVPRSIEGAVTQTLPMVALVGAAVTLWRQGRSTWVALAAGGSAAQYVLTACLIGVQPRYVAGLYPLAAVAGAIAWLPAEGQPHRQGATRLTLALLIGGFAAASLAAGHRYASGVEAETAEVEQLRDLAHDLPEGAILVVDADMEVAAVAYALLPRFVISAHPDKQDAAWAGEMLDRWGVVAVLIVGSATSSPIADWLSGQDPTYVGAATVRGEPAELWSL